MQLDMFATIENSQFELRPIVKVHQWLKDQYFFDYMVARLAVWVMMNPLGLTTQLHSEFDEYSKDVVKLMSRHTNQELMVLKYRYTERLVEIGYFNRYVASYTIKYQNPRSYKGNLIKGKIQVVDYGINDDVLGCFDFQQAMEMMTLCKIHDYHKKKVWKVSHHSISNIFTEIKRQVKKLSPSLIRG